MIKIDKVPYRTVLTYEGNYNKHILDGDEINGEEDYPFLYKTSSCKKPIIDYNNDCILWLDEAPTNKYYIETKIKEEFSKNLKEVI